MLIEKEKIEKAKKKLDTRNAELIAELLNVENYDAKNMKGCCPFHSERTPSFIYNPKAHNFHCFGCNANADILDAFMHTGLSYIESCKRLFEEAEMNVPLPELGVKTKHAYKYPHEEPINDKTNVYRYLELRGISKKTIDDADVREDAQGNIVFNYYDTNGVLTMVKYRPSRKIDKSKGEIKSWCQKDADTAPLLFNMHKINPEEPLIITEGEVDSLSLIEAGIKNAVSVPLGSQNLHWIEENFEWLEQFNSIVICGDNDEPGVKMRKEVISRLGSWRCKYVDIPKTIIDKDGKERVVKDANEVLYYLGKDKLREMVYSAQDAGVPSVVDVSDIEDVNIADIDGVETGIDELDHSIMRLFNGTLTVVSGTPGCVDRDTEYFNGKEWKKISEFVNGEQVLQYNEDGTALLVTPSQYIKLPCDKFYYMHNAHGFNQMVSEEHNVVYINHKTNKLCTIKMTDLYETHNRTVCGFAGRFIPSFRYEGNGVDISDDEIRLMCAVIADGHFNDELSPNAKTYGRVRLNLKKARKKERIVYLLNKCNIPFEEHKWNDVDDEYMNYLFDAPIRTKQFPNEWYDFSTHQKEIFMDEVLKWDGRTDSKGRMSFCSTDKHNADFVQFVFSSMGHKSTISIDDRTGEIYKDKPKYIRHSVCYRVVITQKQNSRLTYNSSNHKNSIDIVDSTDGYKYCFTVPSHMLILRRDNDIMITGNCGKTSFLSQLVCQSLEQGIVPWMYSREMPNYLQRFWIYSVMAGPTNMEKKATLNGTEYYVIPDDVKNDINKTYKNGWFLYRDDSSNALDDVLESMESCKRKYGASLFIIDNLMTLDIGGNDDSRLQRETETINRLISFAIKWQVAVILVAHPRKLQQGQNVGINDVAGSMNIINLAHRTISLRRIDKVKEQSDYNVELNIIKDRLFGKANVKVNLYYDIPSRRFYTNDKEFNYHYKWEKECNRTMTQTVIPPAIQKQNDEVFGNTSSTEGEEIF